jgi:hypothetical protein
MRERNGLVIAALVGAFATAAFSVGNVILGAALTVVTVLLLLGSFADRLPALHRLPLVGAAPLPAVEFHFEDTGRRTFVMDHAPQDAVLVVGLTNDGHIPIPGTLLNAYVVGSTEIQRCTQDGDRNAGGGGRLRGPDAPYWSQSDVTIGRGSTVWFFKVTLPGPGDYHAYLLLNSPAFYGREDVRYDAKIRAVAR